eukprot:g8688.t1
MRWLHWHSIILSAKAILASAGSACSASAAVVGGEPARAGTQATTCAAANGSSGTSAATAIRKPRCVTANTAHAAEADSKARDVNLKPTDQLRPLLPTWNPPPTRRPTPEELEVGFRVRFLFEERWWAATIREAWDSELRVGFDGWPSRHDQILPRDTDLLYLHESFHPDYVKPPAPQRFEGAAEESLEASHALQPGEGAPQALAARLTTGGCPASFGTRGEQQTLRWKPEPSRLASSTGAVCQEWYAFGCGREDTLERAHREMLMGNGPRPDLESTRPEAPPVATHSTSSSPSRTVQGSTSSPSRPRGAAAAASPGGSPFFVEPNQDSSTTTVSTKRQEDEAQREEPEVQHSSQPRNAREPSSPTRLPKEILRKRKGPSLRSSRNSSFVMRHQRSSVSEMSEDEAMSPASGALPAALASGPGLTKLIEDTGTTDTVADYVRSKDFISFINQQCDLPFVHQCIQRLSEMVPDLQAQQSEMQKERRPGSPDLVELRPVVPVDEDLQSSKATLHRSLELRATEETTAQLAKRVTKNEKFSEQGIDAILQSVEGRVLEFLSEGEAERARLWHQMSVLFPRFIQEGNEKKPMSVSEARAYALDVRLDSLEDFVVRRSGTPRRSRSFPAAAGRNLADVAEVTDGALVEDGHEEAEAADEDVGRSSGSRSEDVSGRGRQGVGRVMRQMEP